MCTVPQVNILEECLTSFNCRVQSSSKKVSKGVRATLLQQQDRVDSNVYGEMSGKDTCVHETDAYVDVNWEMSGRDACVHHSESGMYVEGDTGGQDAAKVDGEMSGRDACVQKQTCVNI